ncbi:MAG: outer membrane beta-barrel protein [Bacteroidales bacterium]
MEKNINNTDWSDAIKKSLRDAETPANDRLWERIESTLDTTPTPVIAPHKKYYWKIATTIAATAAVLALIFFTHDNDITITNKVIVADDIISTPIISETPMIAEIQTIEQEPTTHPISRVAINSNDNRTVTKIEEPTLIQETTTNSEPEEDREISNNSENNTEEDNNIIPINIDTKQPKSNKLSIIYAGGIGQNKLFTANNSREAVIYNALSTQCKPAEISFDDIYNSSNITHHQPFGVGIRVERNLSNRFSVNSGVNYTLLLSDVDMIGNENLSTQQIHFIGVPIHANFRFIQYHNLSIYAGAGATIEYCISAKVGSQLIDERDWHYSADINLGAEYTLTKWLGLYFEPSISHYFTRTNLSSIRNQSPTTFNLHIGLSFKL